MKKITLMFLTAIFSFMLLSYIGQYKDLVIPLLRGGKAGYEGLLKDKDDKAWIRKFLASFNQDLSEAYLDHSKISGLSASEGIKREISEEIAFLNRRGLIMDVKLKELNIKEVNRLSLVSLRVKARENVALRYLASGTMPDYTDMTYEVIYTLISGPKGLVVEGFEVVPEKNEQAFRAGGG